MKLKLIAVCLGVSLAASAAAATTKIGVIDMQKIAKQSSETKVLAGNIKKQFSARRQKLLDLQNSYQKDLQNLQKNQSVMKASDLNALKAKVSKEAQELEQKQGVFQRDLYAAQNKAMSDFLASVEAAATKVAKAKHYDTILPRKAVLYYEPSMDVTNAVLSDMKK